MNQPKDIAIKIAEILDGKKAENILVLEVTHLTVIADCFVICSGRSTIQVRALGEEVEDQLSILGIEPRRKEGFSDARWAVLDYGSIIVHIFHEQEREYYNLERLWMDGSNRIEFTPA